MSTPREYEHSMFVLFLRDDFVFIGDYQELMVFGGWAYSTINRAIKNHKLRKKKNPTQKRPTEKCEYYDIYEVVEGRNQDIILAA